ncbi:prenyltransferase/squalene oxidase repeat-containing protein [Clostridium tetani]|uniref:prenyltransferase/squalene oxidase repeat-containing protein n=1 Tax=Clostridium tetani TaxID=1513 RepID=UPI00100B28D6|nr:prenyltransferase/squalene oxidase repeat-containing protein [Clostridium tetani]RXI52255.1 hypothetical protein DP124_08605 [Clostridium tetani]RXI52693.1 hypothetical protein DP122_09100 [Clostridium tetani]RXM69857.1 hypothetical protein DP139_07820 [Clostridium tetani]BDR63658.1 hypothetical protein K134307016_05920 [Clostridium tetani]BDR66370.1 hypothetical protein K144312032_05980 [Clostridium tetani]
MLKKSKFKKIISTSIMTLMLAGTIDSGILGMRQVYVYAAESTQVQTVLKKSVSLEDVIQRTCKAVLENHYSMDWAAIGLDRAGNRHMIPADYLQKVEEYLKDPKNQSLFESRPTEYERITLGVLAAGGDPTNVNGSGINLIEKIYNADLESQGINALVFGLIALDAKGYEIPEDATWNREKLVNAILDKQCDDGGWAFFGSNGDPDMTGMAMTALAPYKKGKKVLELDNAKVNSAVNEAVEFLSDMQNATGGFESWGTVNSESCAQVIMGLCTNGIDAGKDKKFVKNGRSVVDALLSFEVEGGGFAHINDERFGGVNGMATEQALYALDQYKLYLDTKGQGSIYDWSTYPSSVIK